MTTTATSGLHCSISGQLSPLTSVRPPKRTRKNLDLLRFAYPITSHLIKTTRLHHCPVLLKEKEEGNLGLWRRKRISIVCSAAQQHTEGENWLSSWVSRGPVFPEKVLRLIAGATSSPICQFIESPTTFLHSIDPRIKLVWLLAFVVLPTRSHIYMQVGLVAYLVLLSVLVLPARIWRDQLGRVAFLSGILFIMLGFGSDGLPSLVQPRSPPPSMMGLPSVPSALGGYSYSILKLGPLHLTRKGLALAGRSACLSFSIFQSVNLCLSTTTPEQLASALRWFMLPLKVIGVPVAEITLTLLLSLRFINLVFDEVRNAALGIVARRIHWQRLTLMETLDNSGYLSEELRGVSDNAGLPLPGAGLPLLHFLTKGNKLVFFVYVRRIFKNIFSHAEQIAQAMIVRGFKGDSDTHKICLFSDFSLQTADLISLLCLLGLICAAIMSEIFLI